MRVADFYETKAKRLNLLIRPTIMEALRKIAVVERTSVNDIINKIVEEYVTENADKITKYEQARRLMGWD